MPDEIKAPPPAFPEPKTWLGRQLWDIRGVLMGPPGQRAYDRKRVTLLVVLLVIVQLGAQGFGKVVTLQFEAHDKLISSMLKVQEQARTDQLKRQDENTAALRLLACEMRAGTDTTRAVIFKQKPPERKECK
jgi:hypothetical protein